VTVHLNIGSGEDLAKIENEHIEKEDINFTFNYKELIA
jgi:hypothetical protein